MEKRAPTNRALRVTLIKARATTVDGERWIEGFATTPEVDRAGDIVDPTGAKYELPIPLLWQHKHDEPIGAVTEAHATSRGIRIKARLSAGVAKADEIWQLISDGVLNAVSIGFRSLQQTPLKGGGSRFKQWEWLELSVVSVPAQPGAKVSIAKMMAYDLDALQEREAPTAAPLRKDIVATDWKAAAREAGTRIAQEAASQGGTVADVAARVVVGMHLHNAEQMERLESRIRELEGRGLKYAGVWQRALAYVRGDVSTHKGSAWIALADTGAEPGTDAAWQLMVKRGRDA